MLWLSGISGGPRRVNHAAVAIGDLIFSFGGYCAEEAASTSSAEEFPPKVGMDVHVLDTRTLRWTRRPVASCNDVLQYFHTPYQRYGHTAVAHEGKAYIFGGRSDPDGSCNQVFRYDPEEHRFEALELDQTEEEKPGARDGHSAVVAGEEMVIFGGFIDDEQVYGQDVWAFHFERRRWRQVHAGGALPSWRDFHTATFLHGKMYVFGGRSDDTSQHGFGFELYDAALYALDLAKERWEAVEALGDCPTGRRSHSAWAHDGRLLLFGGYNGLTDSHFADLRAFCPASRRWSRLRPAAQGPGPRRRQVTVQVGEVLYLFGGTTPLAGRDAAQPNSALSGENEAVLRDLDDLHLLAFRPRLVDHAAQAVIRHGLARHPLPRHLQDLLRHHSEPNRIPVLSNRPHPANA